MLNAPPPFSTLREIKAGVVVGREAPLPSPPPWIFSAANHLAFTPNEGENTPHTARKLHTINKTQTLPTLLEITHH